jgi:DNA-binding NarL/FixJ family response regulator
MIRLLLVEDRHLISQGLQALLSPNSDLQVVGCAENGRVALELVASLKPDIVLMDIQIPLMTGIEATRLISEQFPDTKVLMLSPFDDERNIAQSMQAGAKGYLLIDSLASELADAVRLAYRGYSIMAPGLMEKLAIEVTNLDKVEAKSSLEELTQLPPRSRDVLRLIGQGHTNREIAAQLHLTEGTVRTYVSHLLNQMMFKNRSQLAIYANDIAPGLKKAYTANLE